MGRGGRATRETGRRRSTLMMMTVSSERGEQSFPACLFIHVQINRQRKTTLPAVVLFPLKMSFLHFLQKHNIFFSFQSKCGVKHFFPECLSLLL